MASSLNTQLSQIVSWKANRRAIASNAFHIPWANVTGYTFPPFSLIAKDLVRVESEGMPFCLVILSLWKTHHWYLLLPKNYL